MSKKKGHVLLNPDVGRHLLHYLKGVDAISFIEAVHQGEQFRSIEQMCDHQFINIIKKFPGHSHTTFSRSVFADFAGRWTIDQQRRIWNESFYSDTTQPRLRMFVHSCFTTQAFSELNQAYRTLLFKCYCLLLSFNSATYSADFGLLNYEWCINTLAVDRDLSEHEMNLFRSKSPTIDKRRFVH